MGNGLTKSAIDVLQGNGGETIFNKVAFSVHRNGSTYNLASSNTPTKIQFTTVEFDQDFSYDNVTNFQFAPKPGKYMLMGSASTGGASVDQGVVIVMVYKNGNQYKSGDFVPMSGTADAGSHVACMVIADPGDVFDLRVAQVNPGASTITMTGAATDCWFQGFQIG